MLRITEGCTYMEVWGLAFHPEWLLPYQTQVAAAYGGSCRRGAV